MIFYWHNRIDNRQHYFININNQVKRDIQNCQSLWKTNRIGTDMKYLLTSYSSQPSKNKTGNIRQLNPQQYSLDDNYLFLQLLKNPNIRIYCDICCRNVTIITHIAVDDFDYCVGCFAKLEDNQSQDTYRVRSTLLYSLTEPHWLCFDQILLLSAFQKWGFGNWGEVKDYMNFNGSKFNRNEIQQHYDLFYLSSEQLIPKISDEVFKGTKQNQAKQAVRFQSFKSKKNSKKPFLQLKSNQSIELQKKPTILPQQNILGYNPKRKCFYYDLEYDEKAEVMLADLEFKDDDTPEQIQLKFQIIQSYNHRLDERLKRYEFTIQHHILDIDYRFKQQFSASKYQKQAFMLFRPFTRFQTHEQNLQTMQIIAKNNYYKSLIQGLKKCRKKIDKEGRIDSTLDYLRSKEDSLQKLGHPRKVYCMSMQSSEPPTEQQKLRKLEQAINQNQQGEPHHQLRIIYRSNQN